MVIVGFQVEQGEGDGGGGGGDVDIDQVTFQHGLCANVGNGQRMWQSTKKLRLVHVHTPQAHVVQHSDWRQPLVYPYLDVMIFGIISDVIFIVCLTSISSQSTPPTNMVNITNHG